MNALALLARERRRALAWAMALVLPWLALAAVLAWRDPASPLRWIALALALVAVGMAATWAWQRHDARWLALHLDRAPQMEDSTGLLLGLDQAASPLAALQRSRVEARFDSLQPARWLPRRPLWPLLVGGLLAGIGIALVLLRPAVPAALLEQLPVPLAQALQSGPPGLQQVRLHLRPPPYTGLPARRIDSADARMPQGSTLRWELRIGGDVRAAWLQWDDGTRVPLQASGGTWSASRTIARSGLYRIATQPALPAAQSGLHRIEVVADRPPQVRATLPTRSLNLRQPGQRSWPLRFVATDDYGVASSAQLRIIQTSGEGENITSSERTVSLGGSGPPAQRGFAYTFDLARSGLTVGNDVIVQLTVRDNRQPQPQVVRSASVILRWPPEKPGETGGLELMLQRTLPAYFRSQRQIIIDAEKLLALRPTLAADEFMQRSDALGVDQRTLRLRYGQFLGEEAEDGPRSLPTNDVEEHDDHADAPAGSAAAVESGHEAHGHEQPPGVPMSSAQAAEAAVAEVGHVHDLPEAATLLDPETKEVLRSALRQMWSSEGELRGGRPEAALPFARRALEFIKKVQEADRIYLPRLGSELPPIDEGRRLTGKREGLAGRSNPFTARPVRPDPLAGLWQAFAPVNAQAPLAADATAGARDALRRRSQDQDDALAALVALDAVERDPACAACRAELRRTLWPLLQPATPAPTPRRAPDDSGKAYLDALQRGGRP